MLSGYLYHRSFAKKINFELKYKLVRKPFGGNFKMNFQAMSACLILKRGGGEKEIAKL